MERVHLNESLYICLPTKRVTRETFLQRFARSLEKTLWQDVCINMLCVDYLVFIVCLLRLTVCISVREVFSFATRKANKQIVKEINTKVQGVCRKQSPGRDASLSKYP